MNRILVSNIGLKPPGNLNIRSLGFLIETDLWLRVKNYSRTKLSLRMYYTHTAVALNKYVIANRVETTS